MLFTLKDDSTTGNFWLYYLFYILSVIYVYIYTCKGVHLYIITVCTDGMKRVKKSESI